VARVLGFAVVRRFTYLREPPGEGKAYRLHALAYQFGRLLFPVLAAVLMKVSAELAPRVPPGAYLITTAITLTLVYCYIRAVLVAVTNPIISRFLLVVGVPLLALQAAGVLPVITNVLDEIALEIGNIRLTLLGVIRVAVFGSLLFWLGRVSSVTGQQMIRNQRKLDMRTRELAAKLFEIAVFVVVGLLLLQVMGIDLTTLAVFGGAVGVGVGFGLQSIASNFISGMIILLDRSLTIGDYIELEDGRCGYVRALNLRSTTLETFEGKDIFVPNETFITSSFVNWTRNNEKQRYRVDFSVAYGTDIRHLCEVIKAAVAEHPQVLSGEQYPIEERPDCEIDSFGDSGVNMFVEFWIEAVDDGKNRVGGDLLLIIYETMNAHGFVIPFPQREVRIVNEDGIAIMRADASGGRAEEGRR